LEGHDKHGGQFLAMIPMKRNYTYIHTMEREKEKKNKEGGVVPLRRERELETN
jgi:hypothetical protein